MHLEAEPPLIITTFKLYRRGRFRILIKAGLRRTSDAAGHGPVVVYASITMKLYFNRFRRILMPFHSNTGFLYFVLREDETPNFTVLQFWNRQGGLAGLYALVRRACDYPPNEQITVYFNSEYLNQNN